MSKRQVWLDQQRAKHRARVERRKEREMQDLLSRMPPRDDIEQFNAEIERQEREEADEDRAFALLETTDSLDGLIAQGLVNEDEHHVLTITEAGWALAQQLGWEGERRSTSDSLLKSDVKRSEGQAARFYHLDEDHAAEIKESRGQDES